MVVALSFRAAQSKEAGIRTLVALDDQGGEFPCPPSRGARSSGESSNSYIAAKMFILLP